MTNESAHSRKESDRAGPQGTQVFSRDQLTDMLDEDAASANDHDRASLVLLSSHPDGRKAGGVFPLISDRVTIGRSTVCDLCIEEPSMSSEHARLVYSDDAWRVINLLSTNGVFVNDEKVFSHRLHDGDEIRLGRTRLRFRDPQDDRKSRDRTFFASWPRWAPWTMLAIVVVVVTFWMLR